MNHFEIFSLQLFSVGGKEKIAARAGKNLRMAPLLCGALYSSGLETKCFCDLFKIYKMAQTLKNSSSMLLLENVGMA